MTLKQNIISLAFLDKNYSLVIQRAKSSLLGMSRSNDIKPLMYTGSLGNLISSLILTRQYDKALKYTKQLLDFNDPNYSNQAYLFNLYIYLKMEDFAKYDLVVKQIDNLFNDGQFKQEKYTCYKLIDSLKDKNKKDMSVFGEKLKPIISNTLLGLTKIGIILKNEYEKYLKDNNKYIDVLDMRV